MDESAPTVKLVKLQSPYTDGLDFGVGLIDAIELALDKYGILDRGLIKDWLIRDLGFVLAEVVKEMKANMMEEEY